MLDTKRYRQSKARCGPASLKIVARFYGVNISEAKLNAACRVSAVSGTTGKNLVAAARRLGFEARIVDNASLVLIQHWLRKGVPVIVDWMSIGHRHGQRAATGHYSVVCGLTKEEIVLEDPAIGRKRRVPRPLFLSLWYDFKYLAPRRSADLVIRRMVLVTPDRRRAIPACRQYVARNISRKATLACRDR